MQWAGDYWSSQHIINTWCLIGAKDVFVEPLLPIHGKGAVCVYVCVCACSEQMD